MKILVSSKYLASKLNELDLKTNLVDVIQMDSGMLMIHTDKKCAILRVEAISKEKYIYYNDGGRWDWLCDLANQIDDQPITLDITEKRIKVTLDY